MRRQRPARTRPGIVLIARIYSVPFVEYRFHSLNIVQVVYNIYYFIFFSCKIRGYVIIAFYSVYRYRIAQSVNRVFVSFSYFVSEFYSAVNIFQKIIIVNAYFFRGSAFGILNNYSVDIISRPRYGFYNGGRIPR